MGVSVQMLMSNPKKEWTIITSVYKSLETWPSMPWHLEENPCLGIGTSCASCLTPSTLIIFTKMGSCGPWETWAHLATSSNPRRVLNHLSGGTSYQLNTIWYLFFMYWLRSAVTASFSSRNGSVKKFRVGTSKNTVEDAQWQRQSKKSLPRLLQGMNWMELLTDWS